MRRISIIGLGLIGGSLALALRRAKRQGLELIGHVRRPETASLALKLGAVDQAELDLTAAVKGADLVVIATPPLAIKDILTQIAPHLPPQCVVTDTASTKAQVMSWAEECLLPVVSFVGGHPMAGKEYAGLEAAEAGLFDNCIYCLTPAPEASPEAIERATILVEQIGAKPLIIDALEHDREVAGISHLPMLISAALVSATTKASSWPRMAKLAATGYHDLTRLASGSPQLNRDICLTNQRAILYWIDELTEELQQFRQLIGAGNDELGPIFVRLQEARERWLAERT